jgi:hypothetical protein
MPNYIPVPIEDQFVNDLIEECRDLLARLSDAIGYGRLTPNQITDSLRAINWMLNVIQAYNSYQFSDITARRSLDNEYRPVVLKILESVNM